MIKFRVPFDGATGTIDAGVITCTNPTTEKLLRTMADQVTLHSGLPDPDRELFDQLPFALELVQADPPSERAKGRIY